MPLTKKITVALGLDDKEFNTRLSAATKKLNFAARDMQKEGRRLSILSREIFMGLTLPMGLLGNSVFQATAQMEKMSLGLKTIAASNGITAIGELQVAVEKIAKLPGLGLQESFRAVQQLLSVGIGKDDTLRVVEGLGIGIARAGGSAENFDRVMRQLIQGLSKGKLEMQDFKTIFEQMPESRRLLEAAFGPGMSDLDKLRKAGISVKDVMFALADGFHELGAEGFMDSLSNQAENLGDSWLKLRSAIGEEIFGQAMRDGMRYASGYMDDLTEAVRNLSPFWKEFIVYTTSVAAAVAVLVPTLAFLIKTWLLLKATILGGVAGMLPALASFGAALVAMAPHLLAVAAGIAAIDAVGATFVSDWKGIGQEWKEMAGALTVLGKMKLPSIFGALPEKVHGRRGGGGMGFLSAKNKTKPDPIIPDLEAIAAAAKKAAEEFKKFVDLRNKFRGIQDSAIGAIDSNLRQGARSGNQGIGRALQSTRGVDPEGRAKIQQMRDLVQSVELGKQAWSEYFDQLEAVNQANALFNEQMQELYAGEIGKGIEGIAQAFGGFVDDALNGAPDAFGNMAKAFGKAIKDMLVSLVTLIAKLAIAAALVALIFPQAGGLKGFASSSGGGFLKSIFGSIGIPGFAGGGVMGGNSPYGDKILARVNSGELMLNKGQQKAVYNSMNGGGVRIYGELRARGRDLVYVLEETQKQINGSR